MIAGNATPSDARMMWKPSVNAIWLRAASSWEASGMAAVTVPPSAPRNRGSGADPHAGRRGDCRDAPEVRRQQEPRATPVVIIAARYAGLAPHRIIRSG